MNSLCRGVWGSFTTPRSRALGGKSGMTRAAPLVFSPLDLAAMPRLFLLLACLTLWRGCAQGLPPDPPPFFVPFLGDACMNCRDELPDLGGMDSSGWMP